MEAYFFGLVIAAPLAGVAFMLAGLTHGSVNGERIGWNPDNAIPGADEIRIRLGAAIRHEREALDRRVRAEQAKLYGGKNPSDEVRAQVAATVAAFRKRDAAMQWLLARVGSGADYTSDIFHERLRRLDNDPEHGELFWFRDDKRNSVVFLLVTCPSTKETHIMLVPTHIDTAEEARAWTFGMTRKEFKPAIET